MCGVQDSLHVRLLEVRPLLRLQYPTIVTGLATAC